MSIPLDELQLRFARSSGPGGQNVNRTSTRVELRFDLRASPSLSEAQRALLLARLGTYLDQEGVLHLVSQATRSQLRNREDVLARFALLLRRALQPTRPRRPTAPSRAVRERRLASKRVRSAIKTNRQRVQGEE